MSLFSKEFNVAAKIEALPKAWQITLFKNALRERNATAANIILGASKITSEGLGEMLFYAAQHDVKQQVKILLDIPQTNVNFTDENHKATSLMRALSNKHGDVVLMLLEREDLDLNYSGSAKYIFSTEPLEIFSNAITSAFGRNQRNEIDQDRLKPWEKALFNDPRIDWKKHDKAIREARPIVQAATKKWDAAYAEREKERARLKSAQPDAEKVSESLGLKEFYLPKELAVSM